MLRARRAIGILILLISLVILLWGIWPQATLVRTSPVEITFQALPSPNVTLGFSVMERPEIDNKMIAAVYPSSPISSLSLLMENPLAASFRQQYSENRVLVLEWPPRLRVGDAGFLRTKLITDLPGGPSLSYDEGENVPGNPANDFADSPSVDTVFIEASLDMPGLQVTPVGEISGSLHPDQPVMFVWNIHSPKAGTYQGTIWLHVRLVPPEGGSGIRKVLSAPRVEIQTVDFLGLNGAAARILGSVGVIMGSILGLDGLFSRLWDSLSGFHKSGSNL